MSGMRHVRYYSTKPYVLLVQSTNQPLPLLVQSRFCASTNSSVLPLRPPDAALCPTDVDLHTQSQIHPLEIKGGGMEGDGGEGEGGGVTEEEEEEEEEGEDPLAQSMEDEVGKLLRATLRDLEAALQVRVGPC